MGACVVVGEVPIGSGRAGSGLFFVEGEVTMAMVSGGSMYLSAISHSNLGYSDMYSYLVSCNLIR